LLLRYFLKLLLGAALEVTDDGEVLYSFPANGKRLLQQRSIARQFKTKVNEVNPLLRDAFRGTFVTALVASLVFLVAIVILKIRTIPQAAVSVADLSSIS
jgi:hypothetical protein